MDALNQGLETLQAQLDLLLECIRENEAKQHRFEALEARLLTLNSLNDLVRQTLNGVRETFELDDASLILVDDSHQLRLILRDDGVRDGELAGLHLIDDSGCLQTAFGDDFQGLYIGGYWAKFCEVFFARNDGIANGSIVVLPLIRRGQLLGSLNLASSDSARFHPGMATDFLERLAQILAVCLENTLNFELLRRASLKDMLTGVNNRRFFDQRLDEEINRVLRSGECLSCLFLDIDHFKRINDTYGHQAGDVALVAVAHCIRGQLRNNDVLARYGGEEFVALLSVSSEEGAVEVAERIRRKVENAVITHSSGQPIHVTISVGIAMLDPNLIHERSGSISMHLIGLADRALYQAKDTGRNRVVSGGLLVDADTEPSPMRVITKRRRNRKAEVAPAGQQTEFNW